MSEYITINKQKLIEQLQGIVDIPMSSSDDTSYTSDLNLLKSQVLNEIIKRPAEHYLESIDIDINSLAPKDRSKEIDKKAFIYNSSVSYWSTIISTISLDDVKELYHSIFSGTLLEQKDQIIENLANKLIDNAKTCFTSLKTLNDLRTSANKKDIQAYNKAIILMDLSAFNESITPKLLENRLNYILMNILGMKDPREVENLWNNASKDTNIYNVYNSVELNYFITIMNYFNTSMNRVASLYNASTDIRNNTQNDSGLWIKKLMVMIKEYKKIREIELPVDHGVYLDYTICHLL
ncbi:hypothetical protein NEOKW01_1878 [Nematocida sp. AWRm80]|nr:hypothetical protein NEOKW01_1878 [Nematocida sp. AWRm80]